MKRIAGWFRGRGSAAAAAPAAGPSPSAAAGRDGQPPLDELRAFWDANGYLVLPGFYDDAALEAVEADVARSWSERAPRIVVDDLVDGRRSRLADVDPDARRNHRFKTNDLYLESAAVRGLALNPRLTPILGSLLGQVPVLCNSLNFEQGSGQPDHVDALYMTPATPHHLAAVWVALEDCHVDAGPLRYYAGSHAIPPYVFSNGGHHVVDAEMEDWNRYMEAQVRERNLQPETFAARKGDVFVWSAYLLHGGSPINDPSRTRGSVVFHYYSEHDCSARGETLVPEHGGYWLHRAHQPVPGAGPSGAPPLPAHAVASHGTH